MAFNVRTGTLPGVTGLDPAVVALEDGAGGQALVWPALGFNCFRWQVPRDGQVLDPLYADPDLAGARPTRSGVPVLFPFPNRIRAGKFAWEGKEYQLPLNDPARKNAIHGFACRNPWRVLNRGADGSGAWVRGVFRCSVDGPDWRQFWPADHEVRVTYRLGRGTLRVEAEVRNPDAVPLPFGLGYHPYLRVPPARGGRAEDCQVEVPAGEFWVLEENLPTGERRGVDAGRDLNRPRRYGELQLDDVLTALPARPPRIDGLRERAALSGAGVTLRVFCSPDFREMVVFTPPHRQAFCVEPYTCTTDAINLQPRGVDAGWRVLPPGGAWSGVVELWV
jgi:aldose 1-epimerase